MVEYCFNLKSIWNEFIFLNKIDRLFLVLARKQNEMSTQDEENYAIATRL